MDRRAFVIVLDACGIGELPDAAAYDVGASVLAWLTGRSAPQLPGESFIDA